MVPDEEAVPAGVLDAAAELGEQPRIGVLVDVGNADREPQAFGGSQADSRLRRASASIVTAASRTAPVMMNLMSDS